MMERVEQNQKRDRHSDKSNDEPSTLVMLLGLIAIAVGLTLVIFVASFAIVIIPITAAVVLVVERVKPALLPEVLDKRVPGGFLRTPLVVAGAAGLAAIALNAFGLPGIPLWFIVLLVIGVWSWLRSRRANSSG
jgi:Flp pilus assembly protein TadB